VLDGRVPDLVISRVLAAPRPLVYRAFVDPAQLAQWFAPAGWSVPRDSVTVDARPGGVLALTMVNDDDPAQTSPVNATITELVENELLVGEERTPDGTVLRLRIALSDVPGGTLLELRQGPYPASVRSGAEQGWSGTLDKLDALLSR
jgi:uncharacterized protein YndB with AHSA1/START domain